MMVHQQPLVSVIMIFLNAERFIEEAIESVLAQTYQHWELLLVDDGSSDSSTTIAKAYVARFPERMRYLEHPGHVNCGMSAARNLGIQHARGAYVAFLDADDAYLPEKLERQVKLFAEHPDVGMVCGPTLYWYSWTGNLEDQGRDRPRSLGVPLDTTFRPPTLFNQLVHNIARTPATCSVLVRRATIDKIGGFDERFRGMFEDQVFFFKVGYHVPVFVESGCWDYYRQHPASTSATSLRTRVWSRTKPNVAHRCFWLWLEEFMRNQQITDKTVWRSLRKHLRPYRYPRVWRLLSLLRAW